MGAPEQLTLQGLIDLIQGRPLDPRVVWETKLDPNLNGWIVGRPGSMNICRLANAVRAHEDQRPAAAWWEKMVDLEEQGGTYDNRVACHNGYEPLSGIYWGWALIAEATALHFLRGLRFAATARQALRRSIRRHLGLAALCAAPDVIIRGGHGKVKYRGPAVICAGARSEGELVAVDRTISHVFAPAVEMMPRRAPRGKVADLARLLPPSTWCLSETDRQMIWNLVQGPPMPRVAEYVVNRLLPDTYLAAPFEIARYDYCVTSRMAYNPNANTGATYYARVPTPAAIPTNANEVFYLYPYPSLRVRSKDLIGRGSCVVDGNWVVAENMTREEESRKRREGRNPQRLERSIKLPPGSPRLVFRASREEPLRLEVP